MNNHRMISAFHSYCLCHASAVRESDDHVRSRLPDLHALFGDKPTPFSLTPYVMEKKWTRTFFPTCGYLAEIFEKIGRQILADIELLSAFGFPKKFLDILAVDPGYGRLAPVFRMDGHFVRGNFRIVETNADGSAGMNDSNAIERAVLETAVYRESGLTELQLLDMVTPLAELLIRYSKSFRRSGRMRIGILDVPGVKTASEFAAVRERLESLGASAVIVTPRDLVYRKKLRAGGEALSLVYRRLVTRDALGVWPNLQPLLTAYSRAEVRLVGSFRSEILHNKAILALAHNERISEKLSSAERLLILKHVPRAETLDSDSAARAISNQSRWVLKPLGAYGSFGVVLGRQVAKAVWRRALAKAIRRGGHVIQEYVPAPREPVLRLVGGTPRVFQEMTSVGIFLYDGRPAGAYVRSGPVHPLSISYGAVTRPGFVC